MTVRLDGADRDSTEVDLAASVTTIDNSRLVVAVKNRLNEELNDNMVWNRSGDSDVDTRSVRTDSRPGSRSSSQMRRLSTSSTELKRMTEDDGLMPPPARIPLTKRRPAREQEDRRRQAAREQEERRRQAGTPRDQEVLYEGLKRMTKGRLDDQRGTEINNELPEFLKTREMKSRSSEPLFTRRQSASELTSRLAGHVGSDLANRYIDYIDETFTQDGFVPTLEEAEELFGDAPGERELGFNESKLSLGMGRRSLDVERQSVGRGSTVPGYDGMRVVSRPSIGAVGDYASYETLSTYRTGIVQQERGRMSGHYPPPTAPKPRLGAVEEGGVKRPPPPLPPKPVRGPPPLPPHVQSGEHVPVSRAQSGNFMGIPGEKGHSVSFV